MKAWLVQTTIVDYRLPLFELLRSRWEPHLGFACGDTYFSPALRLAPRAREFAVPLRNHFSPGRIFLWQSGLLGLVEFAPLVIVEFNLRAVSTWRLLARRKRRRLPTVLWGHASGRRSSMRWLRHWMFSRSAGFIAYTRSQAQELRRLFPNLPIWAACNSVMLAADCGPAFGPADCVVLVGRLVANKKPDLAIRGFRAALNAGGLPDSAKLLVVGDGPERRRCEQLARSLLPQKCEFLGHVVAAKELRELYGRAIVSLSAGYVGLSATQSFGHGVPMLIARDEPHSPEIEGCLEGENCHFFTSDDADDLGRRIQEVFRARDHWLSRRATIADWTRERYTFEAMAGTFDEVISRFIGGVDIEQSTEIGPCG
jgi:glycosyltransferase involved in cell wall biosynthesis